MAIEYKKLQNGSDIRGVAMEGIEGQPVTLTQEAVTNIAKAFVLFLQERTGKSELRLSIGRDSRLSGEALLHAAADGILAMGADVADFGLASTPSMFMSTVTKGYEYDGAIMLTASHLPWNRNGLKFFTKNGGLEKSDIASILASAQADAFIPAVERGKLTKVDFLSVYAEGLVERLRGAWSLPTALAFLAWFVFAPQCISTIAITRRETNGWTWPLFMLGYLFALAYVAAGATYWTAVALGL